MRASLEKFIAALREIDATLDGRTDNTDDVRHVVKAVIAAQTDWASDVLYDMGAETDEAGYCDAWWTDSFQAAAIVAARAELKRARDRHVCRVYGDGKPA